MKHNLVKEKRNEIFIIVIIIKDLHQIEQHF